MVARQRQWCCEQVHLEAESQVRTSLSILREQQLTCRLGNDLVLQYYRLASLSAFQSKLRLVSARRNGMI